jgi:hypothetical protein
LWSWRRTEAQFPTRSLGIRFRSWQYRSVTVPAASAFPRQGRLYQPSIQEQVMFCENHSPGKRIALVAAVALCASGIALADDSSMARFGGDSYAYFNRQPIDKSPSAWREANPQGLAHGDLQALASSGLSAFASRLNPPILAATAADPTWRKGHPNGLTVSELQLLSSSSLAAWHDTGRPEAFANVAESTRKETLLARIRKLIQSGGTQAYQ